MKFKKYILTIVFSTRVCFSTVYYEKLSSPEYKVGDTRVESVTRTSSDTKVISTEVAVLETIETVSGNNHYNWIKTISTTEPTVSTTSSRQLEDSMGIFVVMNADSSDNTGLAVYKTLKNNLGNKFRVGDLIIDTTSYFCSSILYNGVTTTGYGITSIKGYLNGIETVETNLGYLECYSIGLYTATVIKYGNAQNTEFKYDKTEEGTVWLSNDYGRVKASIQTSEEIVDDDYTESSLYTEERLLISAPIPTANKKIKSLTTSEELLNENMSGWVWLGALPWIYNANTGNWGYFANQELHVWDANASNWLLFDNENQSWHYLND